METINNLELKDKDVFPDAKILKDVLGDSCNAYEKLMEIYGRNEMTHEWRYYNDGKAWLCKVQKKKRTITWMSAWKGFMQATIYFPLRLIDDVYGLDISEEQKAKIRSTKNVGKSKPCIFEIRDSSILSDFEKVMKLKIVSK